MQNYYKLIVFVIATLFSGVATSQAVDCPDGYMCIAWRAPTQNVDGTTIQPGELIGYGVHYGNSSRSYIHSEYLWDGQLLAAQIAMPSGSFYVAMTAVNYLSEESGYSNEIIYTIHAGKAAPGNGAINTVTCILNGVPTRCRLIQL